ncbi:MAG: tetratricopeptide repeat protein [Ignavibacteriaceae bacterium]
MLFLLAELKYREAQYDEGDQFLEEAIKLYDELGDNVWHARCLDLKGRVFFTLGQTAKATTIFELALITSEKSNSYREQQEYLNKLGHLYLEARKLDQARVFFERARSLSVQHDLLDGYARSVRNIAEIENFKGDKNQRNILLLEGIQTLQKHLQTIQAKPKRAFLLGELGSFYEMIEHLQEAMDFYQKAKKAYEYLSDVGGTANCLGCIARITGLMGNKKEEFKIYQEMKKLLDGSPYYDLIAGAAINLGEMQIELGNLDDAKKMFEEAEFLCEKHHLEYLGHVEKSLKRVIHLISLRKIPALNFTQLVEELFELVNWFPEAKDNIFRLWFVGRKDFLLSNYRNSIGTKFIVFQDDVDAFRQSSQQLHPYTDICLQVVSSPYPDAAMDIIPFPMDKEIFFDCSTGIGSRYTITTDTTQSKSTGNEGIIIAGWSPALPDQAYKLILTSSASDLLSQRIFFLPYERHQKKKQIMCRSTIEQRLRFHTGIFPLITFSR